MKTLTPKQKRYILIAMVFFSMAIQILLFNKSAAAAAQGAKSRWGANYFPNVPLITQDGKKVHFFDDLIKDKVVAINFIFTSCKNSCPMETARMVKVQKILGDRVGKDVFMYSISIDPETDTPAVLKKYTEKFGVKPGWLFLTGKEADITLLRRKLGLFIDEIQDSENNDHNLSLIIGNQRTGRWMKRSPFENPYYLASQLGSWLHNWKLPPDNDESYANAPKLRNIDMGEKLFRSRCATCHAIGVGGGDVAQQQDESLGPDLLGVTQRRERAWLTRWLAEPDKMLEEKDPIIMKLYAQYNEIEMPNLQLNSKEVEALIEYMDEETQRVNKLQSGSKHKHKDKHKHEHSSP